jgi:5-methylcytosine-specific restriction endonuclease McrA
MSKVDPRRNLQSYRRARAALKRVTKRDGLVCWLCGKPFDWSLHPSDRMAWTADHITPLSRGGHITGPMKPAHRSCNSKRNDGRHVDRFKHPFEW